jgi:hypothetical protein
MDQTTPEKAKARPRGAPANVREKMARLDVLAHKAIRFWERTLDEKSDATTGEKIQVSKLVVEYAWGKPKQQLQVDAKVEVNHTAHKEALLLLAQAAHGPVIDAKPLNQLDNLANVENVPLLSHGDVIDYAVSQSTNGGLVDYVVSQSDNSTSPVGISDPPPPPAGTPGGGYDIGQAPPLDTKNDE